ncbi:gfo/Idh/MocA family oxidoreductase [Mucilaginibacter hurinus]|uniref:Gfo/Idh/MocA family oxidoreductase n=1 Tax=Mucilaginibacter hurinus TaxID=2201324 RepID=A0A367GTC5_9SPHI|nr:Gfo/Idh/MocA family oxidoreductase [Mucilaginibacter hurinus]RCH56619.1 gfo/Idh/MocA family oxidoreductase [Mucilaginibacter hurinus]
MQINWGIIGCGDVTEKKSGPAFNKVPNSRLVAVMRRDGEKAADYARRHSVGKWYGDSDAMLNDPDINAVYIATPPAFHLPYALAALKIGLHVYVEKPVTLNADEAGQMAAAAKISKAKLTVAHYRRAVPLFIKIKELLDNNSIGEVRTVQMRLWQSRKAPLVAGTESNWRVQPHLSGGGYFHDLAPHQLDLMLYYFGEPEKYHGFSLNQAKLTPADDNVNGQILFKSGITFNGSWCFNVGENEQDDKCEIVGTKGKITFAVFGNYIRLNDELIEFTHPEHIQQPMIEQVVRYFNDERNNPCSAEEAVTLMEIMDAFTNNPNKFNSI